MTFIDKVEIFIFLNKRKDAMPKSKIDKLIRFHQPPPFWGEFFS